MKILKWSVIFLVLLLGVSLISCDEDNIEAEEPADPVDAPADEDTDDDDEEVEPAVEEENDVMILTDDNFDSVIQSHSIILVEFYAPWCGHCKSLAPIYEKAAGRLKENDPPIPLGKVDATVHSSLGSRFDVSGYPTLKFFKDGSPFDYEGPREEEGIVSYMKEKADPNWKPPPDAVITLTESNFAEITEKEPLMLVEFYAPWCGHCKKLAPEYEKAAKTLAAADPPIKLGKVDATVETTLGSKYEVSGYPTMKLFRFGKAFEYKGGRDTHGIVEYMNKQRGDGSKEVSTVKALDNSVKDDDVTIMGFFKDDKSDFYDTYMEVANDQREQYTFVHTFDAAAASHYKVKQESVSIIMPSRFSSKFEPKSHNFDKADATDKDLLRFFESNQVPLVGHFAWNTREKRYKDTRPLLLMFYTVDFSFDHRQATQMWRNKLVNVAKDYRDITFAIADEDDMTELFKGFGFEESGEEINIGILGEKDAKYPMPPMEEFDADEIREFIDNFKNGKIKPKLKSQPLPKKQKGPLAVVVGNNFEKIVMDPKKDVLIEFYAPWCGHCKSFEPAYKELAKSLKSDKNLVLAKMDATANDSPAEYGVEGFPTIYFAPANNKHNPVKYSGNRDKDDLIKFMKDNAVVSFKKSKDEL